ncbi:hypothetical protein HK102_011530 [Quaeritorhiza haematococci]|nr:hypothetical protein HK102_011530 [Quaeritorhiza haematococci]
MVGKRSEDFADNLDKNRDLLAFNNGVYDLKKGAFRAAEPEDYLTITVGYDFEAKRDAVVEAKIHDFLDKVFPNPEIKKYTLKFLASTLAGHTVPTGKQALDDGFDVEGPIRAGRDRPDQQNGEHTYPMNGVLGAYLGMGAMGET